MATGRCDEWRAVSADGYPGKAPSVSPVVGLQASPQILISYSELCAPCSLLFPHLHLAPTFERSTEGDDVGVFDVSAHWNAVGNTADPHAKRFNDFG